MESHRSTSSNADTEAAQPHVRSMFPGWILLGLAFLLLVSCTDPISTPGTTSQPTLTTPSTPFSTTPTPQLTQQYAFTEQDSGRTLTYTITSRFQIILNRQKYPQKDIQIFCIPPGTLGSVSNLPSVPPPLYAVRYEGVQSGLCIIKNGTFLLIVRIVA